MTTSTKTTFGATVERIPSPSPLHTARTTIPADGIKHPSPLINRYSGVDEYSNPSNPYSAFYSHPSTRYSQELVRSEFPNPLPSYGYLDVESGLGKTLSQYSQSHDGSQMGGPHSRNSSTAGSGKEKSLSQVQSSVWPTRQELEEKAMMVKREDSRKNCNCLGRLNKKQRMAARALITLIVMAAAVGLGVGISRAVGGGVWKGNGQQTPINPES